jgi:hypothetical protein
VTVEALTPLDIERKLRTLVNDLAHAQADLREARDPKVTRGGYTVAEQAAWVDEECADLKFAADKATVVREAAQDRLRVVLAQAEIVRSLGASVRQAYEMAGTAG